MFSYVLGWPQHCAPDHPRTLVAKGDAVWIWPGIPLTVRRDSEILPAPAETIRFWITRLHGPGALDKEILCAVSLAAEHLKIGHEDAAQQVLDALRLSEFSHDGAALMCAVAEHIGIKTLDLPLRASMRTWNARDIALHLPIFKKHWDAAQSLAKGFVVFNPEEPEWDPEKHPRWPAGAPDRQGGEFAPADESGAAIIPVAWPSNDGPPLDEPPEIPKDEPPRKNRYETIKAIGRWMIAALAAGLDDAVERWRIALTLTSWIVKSPLYYSDQLIANLDPPKTLEELQNALDTQQRGYQEYHIVEKSSADADGFSWWQINSRDNVVLIPSMKHREITTWFRRLMRNSEACRHVNFYEVRAGTNVERSV
jgi:hypothetical protein